MVCPRGGVAIRTLARIRGNGFRAGAEGGERDQAIRLIIAEATQILMLENLIYMVSLMCYIFA